MIRCSLLIGLLLSTNGNVLHAKAISNADLGKIQAKLKKTDHLHVKFEQTIFKALRGRKIEQKGEAFFARPNKFRWQLAKPSNEVIVYDGKLFSHYKPSENTLIQHKAKSQRFRQIDQLMKLVLNLDSLTENFDAVDQETIRKDIKLGLKPKADSDLAATIARVDVTVSTARNYLKALRINYIPAGGVSSTTGRAGYLDIRFKNPRTSTISPEKFKIKVPKHVKKSNL